MALGDRLRQIVHSASSVPRLYLSALRAGTGVAGALHVLRISEAALRGAATHGRGVPGRINAMRHFLWQALLTARFDSEVALSIAIAQEVGAPDRRDSDVDRHNNTVGRDFAAAHDELRNGSVGDALALLVPVALEKWHSEELARVRPRTRSA